MKSKLKTEIGKIVFLTICFSPIVLSGFSQEIVSKNHTQMDTTQTHPVKDFLFGDDKPFAQCHASTLIHLTDGTFITAWFGGTREKDDDVGIWMTKGAPGHWEKPFEVAKINNEPHWNPVLFQSPSGKIFLFFKVGKEISEWETWVKTSDDNGETWSAAYELVKDDHGGRGPVRNKPIILSDGVWIAGASNENGPWNVFFDRSKDEGRTWQRTPYIKINRKEIEGKGVIQPTLWESSPGNVHALLRSTDGVICRTDSKDYGKTWSPVYKTSLPNPNSGIDLTRLPDGTLLLVHNTDDKDWGSRGTLVISISKDNGKTWVEKVELENGNRDDEYSYPAIINFGDTVAVTYTSNREKIAFWTGSEEDIIKENN